MTSSIVVSSCRWEGPGWHVVIPVQEDSSRLPHCLQREGMSPWGFLGNVEPPKPGVAEGERCPCGQGRVEAPPAERQSRAAPQVAARCGVTKKRDPAGSQPARYEANYQGVCVRCDDVLQRRHEIVEGRREACWDVCLHLAGVDRYRHTVSSSLEGQQHLRHC